MYDVYKDTECDCCEAKNVTTYGIGGSRYYEDCMAYCRKCLFDNAGGLKDTILAHLTKGHIILDPPHQECHCELCMAEYF